MQKVEQGGQVMVQAMLGGLLPKMLLTPVGLSLPANTQFDEWALVGMQLGKLHGASRWLIADWVNQGEDMFGKERIAEIAEGLDIEPKTLSNWRSVAWAVPMEARRGDLSFSHHAEVVALGGEDQARFLELAASEKLSVVALREAIKTPPSPMVTTSAPEPVMVPVAISLGDPWMPGQEYKPYEYDSEEEPFILPSESTDDDVLGDQGDDEAEPSVPPASSSGELTPNQAFWKISEISQRLTAHERVPFSDIETIERAYGRGKNDALRAQWAHVETCAENTANSRRCVWGDDACFDSATPNGDVYSVDYWPHQGEFGKFEYRGPIGPLTQNGYYCVFLRDGENEHAANPQSWATVHAAQMCRVAQYPKPSAPPLSPAQPAAPVAPASVKVPPAPQAQLMWHGPIHRAVHEFTNAAGCKYSTTYEILQQVTPKGPEFMVLHNGKDEPDIPTKRTLNDAMKAVEQQAHVMLVRSQEVMP